MKFRILIICCFFLSSCSVFYPGGITFNGANYNYDYYAFNEKLDYSEVSYLLNPTNFSGSKFSNGSNLENVVEFFQKKLGKKVTLKKNFKDKNGKLKIPFLINFDITDEEVRFLKSNTKLDYIILSKISYLNELDHTSLTQVSQVTTP
ncbi:hypothetical protein ES044_09865 [Polaribacter sp. IC066]|uniref:hypothetical protein n=1 Tax=Polaribacter sp. IC066 TaxID=57032 RepID=UPI0011BDCA2A|nr:hypothetical protein [Polaribacter sp. IC066]TXD59437.1 hypothetical protein ES044_09865 [Polaribacter sp. IC066]